MTESLRLEQCSVYFVHLCTNLCPFQRVQVWEIAGDCRCFGAWKTYCVSWFAKVRILLGICRRSLEVKNGSPLAIPTLKWGARRSHKSQMETFMINQATSSKTSVYQHLGSLRIWIESLERQKELWPTRHAGLRILESDHGSAEMSILGQVAKSKEVGFISGDLMACSAPSAWPTLMISCYHLLPAVAPVNAHDESILHSPSPTASIPLARRPSYMWESNWGGTWSQILYKSCFAF